MSDLRIPLHSLEGMAVTPDGQHAVIVFEGEPKVQVAIPATQLHSLAALALQMGQRALEAQGAMLQAFSATSWEARRAHDGYVLLVAGMIDNGQLAFRMAPGEAKLVASVLEEAASEVDLPPDARRH